MFAEQRKPADRALLNSSSRYREREREQQQRIPRDKSLTHRRNSQAFTTHPRRWPSPLRLGIAPVIYVLRGRNSRFGRRIRTHPPTHPPTGITLTAGHYHRRLAISRVHGPPYLYSFRRFLSILTPLFSSPLPPTSPSLLLLLPHFHLFISSTWRRPRRNFTFDRTLKDKKRAPRRARGDRETRFLLVEARFLVEEKHGGRHGTAKRSLTGNGSAREQFS